MELAVYIPTRGRIKQQFTMNTMFLAEPRTDDVVVRFVVPQGEARQFRAVHPRVKITTVPDSYRYGDVMQSILADKPGRYKAIVDDDMRLIRRRDKLNIRQKGGTATRADTRDLFARVKYWLGQGYKHGGVSLRQTNQYKPGKWFVVNTRVSGMLFYDSEVLMGEGLRFDVLQERSDFHVILSLFELGYANVVDYEFMVGQNIGTNAPGGCSTYRTPEFLREQALLLAEMHPCVTVINKVRRMKQTAGMVGEEGIPDVRVQWRKAMGNRSSERLLYQDGVGVQLCDENSVTEAV